jgi:hypothetical protein
LTWVPVLYCIEVSLQMTGAGQSRPNEAIVVGSGSHPTPDMSPRCTKRCFGPIPDYRAAK